MASFTQLLPPGQSMTVSIIGIDAFYSQHVRVEVDGAEPGTVSGVGSSSVFGPFQEPRMVRITPFHSEDQEEKFLLSGRLAGSLTMACEHAVDDDYNDQVVSITLS